jgi:hypothetical protein
MLPEDPKLRHHCNTVDEADFLRSDGVQESNGVEAQAMPPIDNEDYKSQIFAIEHVVARKTLDSRLKGSDEEYPGKRTPLGIKPPGKILLDNFPGDEILVEIEDGLNNRPSSDKNFTITSNITSVEAALDEERKSVLALLEGVGQGSRGQWSSASSSSSGGTNSSLFSTPRFPIRSRLYPQSMSLATSTSDATSISNATGISNANSTSDATSISDATSMSDATRRPAKFGYRAIPERSNTVNSAAGYKFSGYIPARGLPASRPSTLRRKLAGPGPKTELVRGLDLGSLDGNDRRRNHAIALMGISNYTVSQSRSHQNRLGLRPNSPHTGLLNTNSTHLLNGPSKFMLDSGVVVDMNSAYRRLSDANLALVGGSLAMAGYLDKIDQNDFQKKEGFQYAQV